MRKADRTSAQKKFDDVNPHRSLKIFSSLAMALPIFFEAGANVSAKGKSGTGHLTRSTGKTATAHHSGSSKSYVTVHSHGMAISDTTSAHIGKSRGYCYNAPKLSPVTGQKYHRGKSTSATANAIARIGFGNNTTKELAKKAHIKGLTSGEAQAATHVAMWKASGTINKNINWHSKNAQKLYNYIEKNIGAAKRAQAKAATKPTVKLSLDSAGKNATLHVTGAKGAMVNGKYYRNGSVIPTNGKKLTAVATGGEIVSGHIYTTRSGNQPEAVFNKKYLKATASVTGKKTPPTPTNTEVTTGSPVDIPAAPTDAGFEDNTTPSSPQASFTNDVIPSKRSHVGSKTNTPNVTTSNGEIPEVTKPSPKAPTPQQGASVTVATKLTDADTNEQVIQQTKGSVTLNENVAMNNLEKGETYKVTTWLVDVSTGKAIESNGQQITGNATYTATDTTGSTDVKLTIPDVSQFKDKKVVAFTDVAGKSNGQDTTIKHEDVNDKLETVGFTTPALTTTATTDNGAKDLLPGQIATVNDKVEYSGLIPGDTYTVVGTLMDKETGKPVQENGQDVQSKMTFKASSSNGSVQVPFQFDASNYGGKKLVVFEKLYTGNQTSGATVAEHEDINSAAQTVNVLKPDLHTTLTNGGQKVLEASDHTTLTDNVRYEGLIPGRTYTVKGKLADQKTGMTLTQSGKVVTATATFKAEKANGTVNLKFTFNGKNLSGHSLVAVEELFTNTNEKNAPTTGNADTQQEIAKHDNLNDTAQTVSVTKKKVIPTPVANNGGNGTVAPITNNSPTHKETVLPQTGNSRNDWGMAAGIAVIFVSIVGSYVLFVSRNHATGLD